MEHYKEHLKGKWVYCNCDTINSNFWKYFYDNFHKLELKHLTITGIDGMRYDYDGVDVVDFRCISDCEDILGYVKGDFRSIYCVDILKKCDVVITNPPFSLFRKYVAQLFEYNKKFLIVGNYNAISYKEIFPYIKENKMWLGVNKIKDFIIPDGDIFKFGNIYWFTNVKEHKRKELKLKEEYTPEKFPKYDNYDAINVDKTKDIPKDYIEPMGVPITFLDKYNPDQFEILGILQSSTEKEAGIPILREYNDFKEMRQDMTYTKCSGSKANGNPVLKEKPSKGNFLYNPNTNEYVHSAYARIVIQRKNIIN